MPRKPLSPKDHLLRLANKQLSIPKKLGLETHTLNPSLPKPEAIIELIKNSNQPSYPRTMQCFICYDIEDNKVRKYISDYLEREGCTRVQKSIFFANLNPPVYDKLCGNLKEVNALYSNGDSIMVIPVYKETIRGLQVIGQSIDFHYIADKPEVVIL